MLGTFFGTDTQSFPSFSSTFWVAVVALLVGLLLYPHVIQSIGGGRLYHADLIIDEIALTSAQGDARIDPYLAGVEVYPGNSEYMVIRDVCSHDAPFILLRRDLVLAVVNKGEIRCYEKGGLQGSKRNMPAPGSPHPSPSG